ncbi:MAG: hypothetical protein U5K84_13415 [Alkalibacterium sp.]|nr:hypothetical protein [Alkalibacterium sp.]
MAYSGSTIAKELGEQHYDVIAVDKDLVDVNRVEEYRCSGCHKETSLILNY